MGIAANVVESTVDTPAITGANVGSPSARRIRQVSTSLPVASRTALGRAWNRFVGVIGQLLVGLPASTWLLIDASILAGALYLAYVLFPPPDLETTPHVHLWQASAVFVFALLLSSLVFGFYERETILSRSRLLTRALLTTAAATAIAYAIIYVVMYATVSRRVSGVAMGLFLVNGVGVRLLSRWAIHRLHRGLLVVGPRSLFDSFVGAQANGFLSEYRLVGYVTTDQEEPGAAGDPHYLSTIKDYVPKLGESCVTDVVVGTEAARDPGVMEWVVPCLQHGCRVTNEAIFYEKATGQILVDEITPYWFLFADLKVHCDERATLKRLMDLVTSLFGMLLTAPLWPLIAMAIRLDDGGPVLYTQERVGQNGRIFTLCKFRTMRANAENGRSVWASPDDPRVTRVGRLLRKTRLDELPQLFNILMGQMSIVGPRPERPDIVASLCDKLPYYAERHLVKPGLTGWAQISYQYGSSVEDAKRKLQFDLYYLKHMSFELDMIILFRTLGTFLRGAC
ncbi:MAG: sugar transferase [Phycisphaerales bacterium]|nr:MAG: sugar transferase [Phycisphaerales bacterium]